MRAWTLRSPDRALLCITAAGALACSPELSSGPWEGEFDVDYTSIDGGTTVGSRAVTMDIALVNTRGPDVYQFSICDGLVTFLSVTPCFTEIMVVDNDGVLTGSESNSFYADYGNAVCNGDESIAVTGEIEDKLTSTLTLTYSLTLDTNSSDSNCAEVMGDVPARAVAQGSAAYTGAP